MQISPSLLHPHCMCPALLLVSCACLCPWTAGSTSLAGCRHETRVCVHIINVIFSRLGDECTCRGCFTIFIECHVHCSGLHPPPKISGGFMSLFQGNTGNFRFHIAEWISYVQPEIFVLAVDEHRIVLSIFILL